MRKTLIKFGAPNANVSQGNSKFQGKSVCIVFKESTEACVAELE